MYNVGDVRVGSSFHKARI